MAEYEPPADLVKLQQEFFRLDGLCGRLDGDELEAARADRLQVVTDKHAHGWWSTVDNRFKADMALRKLAQEPVKTG